MAGGASASKEPGPGDPSPGGCLELSREASACIRWWPPSPTRCLLGRKCLLGTDTETRIGLARQQ